MDQGIDTVGVEGWCANEELIDDDTKRPQIDGVVVWQLLDQLRSHVERSTLDGGEHDGVVGHGARKSEITQLHNSIGRDEDVLRLHVSMDDPVTVQVVQGIDQLLGNLADLLFTKVAIILKDLEELTLGKLSHDAELM